MCDFFIHHASEEVLEAHAMNKLSDRDRARVEEHLSVCDACRKRLRDTEAFIHAIREAARRLSPEILDEQPAGAAVTEPGFAEWKAKILFFGTPVPRDSEWLSTASFRWEMPIRKR